MLLQPMWDGRASIFMLHRELHPEHAPDGASLNAIAASVTALREAGARLVSLRYLFECAARGHKPPPGCVAFTIDDGYADQGRLAREFLRHNCPVTIFLLSGFIDGTLWPWDEKLAYAVLRSQAATLELPALGSNFSLHAPSDRYAAIDTLQKQTKTMSWPAAEIFLKEVHEKLGVVVPETPPPGHEPLTWDEIRRLETEGTDFGPHSVTHRVASQLSPSEVRKEITESWHRLKVELRKPLPVYAWPTGRTGDFHERDLQIAKEAGLLGAVSTNDGYGDFSDPRRLPLKLFRIERFAFAQQVDINVQYGTAIEQLKIRLRALGA